MVSCLNLQLAQAIQEGKNFRIVQAMLIQQSTIGQNEYIIHRSNWE